MTQTKIFTTSSPPDIDYLTNKESFRLVNKAGDLSISVQFDYQKNRWRAYKTVNNQRRQLGLGSSFDLISKNELALESAIRLLNDNSRWNLRKRSNNVLFWQNKVKELLSLNSEANLVIPEDLRLALSIAITD